MSDEWQFAVGDVIREEHEKYAPGGIPLGKTEYKIARRLRDESDGSRYYHVEKEEGGHHLYSAGAIEGLYEVVQDSAAFAPGDEVRPGGGG